MNNSIAITEVTKVDRDVVGTLASLIPQLSEKHQPPTHADVVEIVQSEAVKLFVARDISNNSIVGCLTLVVFRIPTGKRAWLEDVVVDKAYRGRGIGRHLCNKAIDVARQAGVEKIDLTSYPSRKAANRLYQSMGFKLRDTNIYRLA